MSVIDAVVANRSASELDKAQKLSYNNVIVNFWRIALTMHLEGPWLSTTGKKKGKQKFRSAEHARKARELDESWKEMLKRHGIEQEDRKRKRALTSEVWRPAKPNYRGADEQKNPSKDPMDMAPCTKKDAPVYTGTAMKGIGTMHKSNSVPIFSDEEAVAIAKMRR